MNRLLNWLRWLLFLPLSIIASLLVYLSIKIITSLLDNIPQLQIFLIIAGAGLTGYIFVTVAVKMVPKHKIMFSIIMASIYVILAGLILYEKISYGKIVQMNLFGTISLVIVGTIAAVITCYQTYDDLKNSSAKSDNLIDVDDDDSLIQKLEEQKFISEPNSDDLDNQVLQIISEFHSETGEPNSIQLTQNDLLTSSIESDKFIDSYQDSSLTEKFQEDIIISDPSSDDLEKEVLQIMSVLNADLEELESKQLTTDYQLISSHKSDKLIDIFQDNSQSLQLKEDIYITDVDLSDIEKQDLQPTPAFKPGIKAPKRKPLTKEDLLIDSSESDKLIDIFNDDSPAQQLKEDTDISDKDSKDIEKQALQSTTELKPKIEESNRKQRTEDDLITSSTESSKLINEYQEDSFTPELEQDNGISYLNLDDLEQQYSQTTAGLNFLIGESKRNQLTKYVEDFYKSIGKDDKTALINTEIFYLWCMLTTVFNFAIESDLRRKLIKYINSIASNLYLKWKKLTNLEATKRTSFDFNDFSYYNDQMKLNNIHLNSSCQNTKAEILFGKIVLTKIHESIGSRKINVDSKTILMPVQIYYELKQRVIEILNNSTYTICC